MPHNISILRTTGGTIFNVSNLHIPDYDGELHFWDGTTCYAIRHQYVGSSPYVTGTEKALMDIARSIETSFGHLDAKLTQLLNEKDERILWLEAKIALLEEARKSQ